MIEDIALISSVMNACTDPIVGTNQRVRVMWARVTTAYEQARSERPQEIAPRTLDMIKSRWNRIAPQVLKWAGCYDEAVRRKRSGQSEADVLQEAHMIHERKWGKFNLLEQWKILKNFSKWKQIAQSTQDNPRGRQPRVPAGNVSSEDSGSRSTGKRTRADDVDVGGSSTPTSEPAGGSSSRPEGVKKAKSRMTGKKVSSNACDVLSKFGEDLRIHDDVRVQIDLKKEARKQKQVEMEEIRLNWDMYQQLSSKTNPNQWEIDMLAKLHNFFTDKSK